MIFDEGTIGVWAYNIETVLAEKVETILQRGELNTQEFDKSIFVEALKKTAEHRKTIHIFADTQNRIKAIELSEMLKNRWIKYTRNYPYAEDITYEEIINALKKLINY